MDAVTYPKKEVIEFIQEYMISLRVAFDAPLAKDFQVKWTPTLVTLDPQGKEHHRTVGFLPPEQLVPSLLLGMGKCHFDQDQFPEALTLLEKQPCVEGESDLTTASCPFHRSPNEWQIQYLIGQFRGCPVRNACSGDTVHVFGDLLPMWETGSTGPRRISDYQIVLPQVRLTHSGPKAA